MDKWYKITYSRFFSTYAQSLINVYIDYSGQRAVIHLSVEQRNILYIIFESPPNKVIYQVNEISVGQD